MRRSLFLWLIIPFSLTVSLLAYILIAEMKDDSSKKPKPQFTISKETTYFTEPLDADGRVDYFAVLNQRLGKGVTRENNANVLIWKAIGPEPAKRDQISPEFFRLMGVEQPPDDGNYFIELSETNKNGGTPGSKENKEIIEQLERAGAHAWAEKDYPRLASWLKANEQSLVSAVAASKRSHYFLPLTSGSTAKARPPRARSLIDSRLPGLESCRQLCRALAARALLRVANGAVEDAWQDLLACHRLARLIGHGCSLIEALVALDIDGAALQADLAFLNGAKLDAKEINSCLRDLRGLSPVVEVVEKFDLAERCLSLDAIAYINYVGHSSGNGTVAEQSVLPSELLASLISAGVDWDPSLRKTNAWYDRLISILKDPDHQTRSKNLSQLSDEALARGGPAAKEKLKKDLTEAKMSREELGRAVSDILMPRVLPNVKTIADSADRNKQGSANVALAFALAWYQRDHGRYPKELSELTPKYLANLPQDLFSGKGLIYRPRDDGYLLYSVGVNGQDDQGRGKTDQPPGDNLSVRMPLPGLPKK